MKRKLILTVLFSALAALSAAGAEKHMEIDYKEIENSEIIVYNDIDYMPVRTVSEAMGLNVEWKGDSKTVVISNGGPLYITFSIGTNGYTKAKTAAVPYDGEPVLKDGTTFIPVDTFEALIGFDIAETENAYNIITVYNDEGEAGPADEAPAGEAAVASVS